MNRAHKKANGKKTSGTPAAALGESEAAKRIAKLTPREYDVCLRLVSGQPNKIVAGDLNISIRTVEFHRARVMRKTQSRSLPDLVRLALAAGL